MFMKIGDNRKITRADMEYGFGLFGAGFGVAWGLLPTIDRLTFSLSSTFEFCFMFFGGAIGGGLAGGALGYIIYNIFGFFRGLK